MDTLSTFREYMGDDITPENVRRLAAAPEEHIARFIERLAPLYYDWLEKEEATDTLDQDSSFFCVDPFRREQDWRNQLETYKKYLLYFPKCCIPDPLASVLWPNITLGATVSGAGPRD
jgi:hypothetical protein